MTKDKFNCIVLKVDDETKNTINKYLDLYYDRYTGLYLNSKDFLKKLM